MEYTPLSDKPQMLIRSPSNLCVSCSDSPIESVHWPNIESTDLFSELLIKKKPTLGSFLKVCIQKSRKNKNLGMSWPDFCVLAAKEYSILYGYDVQRPDVWRDRMFVLSLIASMI